MSYRMDRRAYADPYGATTGIFLFDYFVTKVSCKNLAID